MLGTHFPITGHIADDLTNTTLGYGFVSDQCNTVSYNRKAFLKKVMFTPELYNHFIIGFESDQSSSFNFGHARKWLSDYSQVLKWIMVAVEVLGGSLIHG